MSYFVILSFYEIQRATRNSIPSVWNVTLTVVDFSVDDGMS